MNFLLETLRLGVGNLRLHLLRSVLTSLGIILGVGAVIVMVSIGEGNKLAALRDIQALGATNVIVRSSQPPESASLGGEQRSFIAKYGLMNLDFRRLVHFLPDAAYVVPLKSVGSEITYRSQRMLSQSFGTTPEMIKVANLRIARGRYLTSEDMIRKGKVAVIGSEVAKQFFRLRDPIGAEFRIDDRIFRVVGVIKPVGLAGGAGSALVGRDLNKDVHIPLSTANLEFGDVIQRRESGSFSGEEVQLKEIYITAASTDTVLNTADRVRQIIQIGHSIQNDVELIVPWELLENAKKTALVWNIVLISIAAISLLVGGIGIMNIMLASVTERTREIGIRRALGATRNHIVAQFLVETGTLTAVGGLLGIILGVGFSLALDKLLPWFLNLSFMQGFVNSTVNLETQITGWSIIASFLVAATVGLTFGIYPAIVASRQDPIVALRHD
ncbi:MAG: ABC transporter permease [Planctomycetes bacterium]|nr:ABC transporter permease [Planctomycetota bacterium]MCH7602546.1 ABC transporter permease [Planctomycetota bacterium]